MPVPHADSDAAAAADSVASAAAESLLDNPILNALLTEHESLALVDGLARRYPAAIGPLAGTPDQSRTSYDALRRLAGPGGLVALFLHDPPSLPKGWSLFRGGILTQMICRRPKSGRGALTRKET